MPARSHFNVPIQHNNQATPVTPSFDEPLPLDYSANPFLARLRPGSPSFLPAHSLSPVPETPLLPLVEQSWTSPLFKNESSLTNFAERAQEEEQVTLHQGMYSSPSQTLLAPGTQLRNGRYRLQVHRGHQVWLNGVYEVMWIAQDAQRADTQVMIGELDMPAIVSVPVQSMLRNATIALTSIGRHPHVPTLWDAFSDQGRSFFVFEPVAGETLLDRMRRTGRAFPEAQAVEMSLQVLDVLEFAAQQVPPLVHGLIQPAHVVINHADNLYTLTNFSIVLAGGGKQLVAGIPASSRSPYCSPEFTQGEIDTRSDLYALVATLYHSVTGSVPDEVQGEIPQAQRLNPTVSSALNALLAKGLHPLAEYRFQKPSELRQALLSTQEDAPALELRRMRTDPSAALQQLKRPVPIQAAFSTQLAPAVFTSREPLYTEGEQKQRMLPFEPDATALDEEENLKRMMLIFVIAIAVCLVILLIIWRFFL